MTFEFFINEAQDYKAMFAQILNIAKTLNEKEYDNKVNEMIKDAKAKFKKNDRIVWVLKYQRFYLLYLMLNEIQGAEGDKEVRDLVNKYISEMGIKNPAWKNQYVMSERLHSQVMHDLEHFYSMNIPEIEKVQLAYQTPKELLDLFKELEREHGTGEVEGTIPYEDDAIGDDVKVIKDFKDGFYWVQLDRPYCKKEGGAMGHCGNTASWKEGDTILSLRRLIKRGKDENTWLWEPHATFILHEDGYLGEMKGRSNDKPSEKYHKYIIALLENTSLIKGIQGGGYDPKNNFDISDLTDEEREKLLKINPELEINQTKQILEALGSKWEEVESNKTYIKIKTSDKDEIVDTLLRNYYSGRSGLREDTIEELLRGDFTADVYDDRASWKDIYSNMVNKENTNTIKKWAEENGYNEEEDGDLEDWLEENGEDITYEIQSAYQNALETAYTDYYYNTLEKSIDSSEYFQTDSTFTTLELHIRKDEADVIEDILYKESIEDLDWSWKGSDRDTPYADDNTFNKYLKDALPSAKTNETVKNLKDLFKF